MTKPNNGGAAFPGETVVRTGLHSTTRVNNSGMTLRDYFAGQALAGVGAGDPEDEARMCYDLADAMMRAREEGEK